MGLNYKQLYYDAEEKRRQDSDEALKREERLVNEKKDLINKNGEFLSRCHKAEVEEHEAILHQQEAESRCIKADMDYNIIYNQNINLRNNAECNKSTSASMLKNTSLVVNNCISE